MAAKHNAKYTALALMYASFLQTAQGTIIELAGCSRASEHKAGR